MSYLKAFIIVGLTVVAIVLLATAPKSFAITLFVLGAYFAPTWIAWGRHVTNQGSILVINLFLGWTLIGWVVALAMAARSVTAVSESDSRTLTR